MKLTLITLLLICVGFLAFSNLSGEQESDSRGNVARTPQIGQTKGTGPEKKSELDRRTDVLSEDIRSFDFANFAYDWFPKYDSVVIKKKLVIRNGENPESYVSGKGIRPNGDYYREKLINVFYRDLNGDSKEEAIVTVGVAFFRWTPTCTFVFEERNGKPVSIWMYAVDDRAHDLRGIRMEDNSLVVEVYDNNYNDAPTCCPARYIRHVFKWDRETLHEVNTEFVPYSGDSREYIGFPND